MALKSPGAYHVEVGTMNEHYPMVGQALIETFAEYLGNDWNWHVRLAWLDAYNLITKIVLEGAQNPAAYLGGELTFYEWLDLYGESSPEIQKTIASTTHFQYRNYKGASPQPQAISAKLKTTSARLFLSDLLFIVQFKATK